MDLNNLQVPQERREELERLLDAAYDKYKNDIERWGKWGAADIESIWGDDFTYPDAESRIEQARRTLERYSDEASQIAGDYYETVRDLWEKYAGVTLTDFDRGGLIDPNRVVWQLAGGFNQTDFPGLKYEDVIPGTDGKVHNKYGKNIEELWPKFDDASKYADYIQRLVTSSGRLTLMDMLGKDPTKPRWARVPNGPTCEFCVMLASRGWVYWTEDSARLGGSFHDGACDCSVVPSWGAQKLKGYDPDKLYEQYKRCAGTAARLVTRDEYRKYEKAYVPKHDKDKPLGYAKWKRNRILAEMRTRERQWLYDGRPVSVSYASMKAKAELKAHEKLTRDALAVNGFSMWFPERSDEEGVTTADCVINGKTVDFKAPKGNGKNTIDQLLRHAAKQGKAAVIHLQEGRGTMTSEFCIESIRKSLERRKLEYVLFIDYDGSITRFVPE